MLFVFCQFAFLKANFIFLIVTTALFIAKVYYYQNMAAFRINSLKAKVAII